MAETNLVTRIYAQEENESSEKAEMKNMSTANSSGNRTMHVYLLIVGAFLSEVFLSRS